MQPETKPHQLIEDSKVDKESLHYYSKSEKTIHCQYKILKCLLIKIRERSKQDKQDINKQEQLFMKLYSNLSPQIIKLPLYQFINYALWNDESGSLQIRQKTKFFKIVTNWILAYEIQVGKLEGNIKNQIRFIREFFLKETETMFEKIILFNQIYDDLIDLIQPVFWQWTQHQKYSEDRQNTYQQITDDTKPIPPKIKNYEITVDDLQEILEFISEQVYHHTIYIKNKGPYMNSILSQILPFCEKYKQFILNAIYFLLKAGSLDQLNHNQTEKKRSLLDVSHQNELTSIVLAFIQRPDLKPFQIIQIVKNLMLHTDKVVRYAMIIDYVKFYDYLQKTHNDDVLEKLEDMIYFRELIIGRNQIDQAGLLLYHTFGTALKTIDIHARSKERIFFSQQSEYGQYTILQIEIMIGKDDITLIIYQIKQGKQIEFWREDKTVDRRVDLIIKEEGLYALEFNNIYSWVKSKKVQYKIEQYGYFESKQP